MVNPKNLSCLIIKPDGYKHKDEIIHEIEKIMRLKIPVKDDNYIISEEIARVHYLKYRDKDFYRTIVEALSNKPTCKMFIMGNNALERIAERAGRFTDPNESREKEPYSWRARWGGELTYQNVVHRPTTNEELLRDVRIHFSLTEMVEKLHTDLLEYLYGI